MNNKEINEFAKAFIDKLEKADITNRFDRTEQELTDGNMGTKMFDLGFKMDCGKAFNEKYGKAFNDVEELKNIIADITDISFLGSAIFSQWRYYNHWAEESILKPENKEWFIIALNRLAELTDAK